MVVSRLRRELREKLLALGLTPESAALEATELACFAAGISRDRWFFEQDRDIGLLRDPEELISRRAGGEPLAYILGEWDFFGLTLKTDRRALIPRDDSVCVLELFLSRLGRGRGEILDLCAGTGCLGLGAASVRPELSVTLCDISGEALGLAEENVLALGLGDRVRTLRGDALGLPPFAPGSFCGMICNPPYLRKDELSPTHEPVLALDGGEDGLDFYRSVSQGWGTVLEPGAPLCFEVGHTQSEAVAELLRLAGFSDIVTERDLSGIPRAVCGIK